MPRPKIVKYIRSSDLDSLVRYLQKHKKAVNDFCQFLITPLMWAARLGNTEITEILLKAGADVNMKDKDGRTALMFAAREGHATTAELLVKFMANCDDQDDSGRSPLMFSASQNCVSVVSMLIRRMATIDLTNYENRTALMYACREGHTNIAEEILDAGGNVNFLDCHGRSPLIFAIYGNHVSTVQLLMSRGADVMIRDSDGWFPIHWAKEKNHLVISFMIQEKMKEVAGKMVENDIDGQRSLFAPGRGMTDLIEMLTTDKIPSMKYVFKSGFVPNPWFEWKIGSHDEFPPDFVFPPLTRRHYKF